MESLSCLLVADIIELSIYRHDVPDLFSTQLGPLSLTKGANGVIYAMILYRSIFRRFKRITEVNKRMNIIGKRLMDKYFNEVTQNVSWKKNMIMYSRANPYVFFPNFILKWRHHLDERSIKKIESSTKRKINDKLMISKRTKQQKLLSFSKIKFK